jgi:hypothetical protein
VLRVNVVDVLLPTLITWGIQLQREVIHLNLRLMTSLEGNMVLNAEL